MVLTPELYKIYPIVRVWITDASIFWACKNSAHFRGGSTQYVCAHTGTYVVLMYVHVHCKNLFNNVYLRILHTVSFSRLWMGRISTMVAARCALTSPNSVHSLLSSTMRKLGNWVYCICSAQSENLRNLEIALRILRIPRLRTIVARSRDCTAILCNLKIAQLQYAIVRLR